MTPSVPTIETPRVSLRPITEADVGPEYLGWFSDPDAVRFIDAARTTQTIDSLRAFVRARMGRADVWFHGMFARDGGMLIGTIKCEPIDRVARSAVMGILIGSPRWRGVGLAAEVIGAVAGALRSSADIEHLDLGVHPENVRAVRAYERMGFRQISSTSSALRMRLDTSRFRSGPGAAHAAP